MPTLVSSVLTYPIGFGCRFGPWITKLSPAGPYVMYWSGNFCVKGGKPVDAGLVPGPYDPNTWNAGCNTFYGDRIWMTTHNGDGLDPAGWDASNGPTLLLPAGGPGQESLIGDPSVVYWNGKWHMYYEGTNYCDGTNNLLFHATSDSWFGPWTKEGKAWGVLGYIETVGLSWVTTFVENGDLYLYYTNAMCRLTCAKASDTSGNFFDMMNEGRPVTPSHCARGQVLAYQGGYMLITDINNGEGGKGVSMSLSDNKFSFFFSVQLFGLDILGPTAHGVGLPTAILDTDGLRVYFTICPTGTSVSSIGAAVVIL